MNIGFISTRLAGTDGVSLESAKWATVLQRMGHQVFHCAGQLAREGPQSTLVPELHFLDREAIAIGQRAFGTKTADPALVRKIAARAAQLKGRLHAFINEYEIDLIIPQNALAIPMHIPLGVAVRDLIADTGIPTIAHHHDFHWERERFRINSVPEILETAFPPDLPSIRHVVINSLAQRDLKVRRGIGNVSVVPNVFDFATPPPAIDDYSADFREDIGLTDKDIFILQPTRVVPRKRIELAIELTSRLEIPDCRLVITHEAGDEGLDYLDTLERLARQMQVDLCYVANRVHAARGVEKNGKVYSLSDAYLHADFVTFPSLWEGFGNALVETVYFKKPLFVNRYPVYEADIGPLGFAFVEIDGQVTDEAVQRVRQAIADPKQRREMVERNFSIGLEHLSYEVLEDHLSSLLARFPQSRV